MSVVISMRLDAEALAALEAMQENNETLNATAKRLLLASLGIDVNTRIQAVNSASDDRIQELIDSKVAYLATALNETRHSLEARIEELEAKLSTSSVIAPNVIAPATQDKTYTCPECGTVGTKPNDFISEGTTKAGTPRIRCKHCKAIKIESKFLALEKSETWEQKASNLLEEVSWQ